MKKTILLIFVGIFLLFKPYTASAEVSVSAQSAIVIDAASKRVLFEKDAYSKRGMASTTKIMTALIALESLSMDDTVVASPFAAGTEGSSIWLSPGEKMSVHDLLYGLMLASGNDAATALAEHTAGSVDAFTVLMNRRAKLLGAYNTNFTNPHGLPDEKHYTTAYDLAIISKHAMDNPVFAEIVATKNKTISWEGAEWDRSLSNHNKLLKRYEYAIGIKTGFTKKDGRCLVSAAEKDGVRLIAVTLSAPDDWNDHINMLDYCFDKYKSFTVCKAGDSAGDFVNEDADDIKMTFEKDFITAVSGGEEDKIRTEKSFNVTYPVEKGQVVGKCDIYYSDEHIGSVNLIAQNASVIKKNILRIIKKLLKGLMMQ